MKYTFTQCFGYQWLYVMAIYEYLEHRWIVYVIFVIHSSIGFDFVL